MLLYEIINSFDSYTHGLTDVEISSIQIDSRKVTSGCLFVALKGSALDGHEYIENAIDKGAVAILCEQLPSDLKDGVSYVQCSNSTLGLSKVLNEFYGHPTKKIKVVGVTGTNGKTTIVTLLYRLFTKLGYNVGLLSTVRNYVGLQEFQATHTTPDPIQLFELLAKMVDAGCEFCFMEVSSHAIHQNRVGGLTYAGGIFTNITHDHLDYHKTFKEYINVKKSFFDNLPKSAFALSNEDDKNGMVMLQNTKAVQKTYSVRSFSDFKVKILEPHFDGMLLDMDGSEVWTKLIGEFNAYNLLAVYSAAILLDQQKDEVLQVLSVLAPADGRFEVFRSKDGKMAIVDYAHTPDALVNVLETISKLRTRNEQVISVVGAGGDRDATKRPVMGKVAAEYSDKVIITADNPRSEDPNLIAEQMKNGVSMENRNKVLTIIDRKEAIRTSLIIAQPGDIVLIAGKGHEDYQEIKGVKHHFDDREIVKQIFEIK